MDVDNSRKLHLRNKANQDRHLQAHIDQFRRRGEPVPTELQTLADDARRAKWRMFSLLSIAGVSTWALYWLIGRDR